ncbi:hypothetical protein O181_060160 [Austropuccinia psidii MF-1]|uniref:Secreted protein n=1 Tax=Austropuccinia psidii MF-1 TaxID=1389203 RepID=A0A9Q3EJX2_9BASI|nr:hypothetical protein [Austropuccinia psidii MF-1]
MKYQSAFVLLVSVLLQFSTVYGFSCRNAVNFTFASCEYNDKKNSNIKHLREADGQGPKTYFCSQIGDVAKCCAVEPNPRLNYDKSDIDEQCVSEDK